MSQITASEMLFYGCLGNRVGHYLLDAHGHQPSYYLLERIGPQALKYLDGGFLPPNARPGVVYRSVIPGWTIIAMVDNSVDTRPGSNAEFLLPGEHSLEEMVALAQAAFPEESKRIGLRAASPPRTERPEE